MVAPLGALPIAPVDGIAALAPGAASPRGDRRSPHAHQAKSPKAPLTALVPFPSGQEGKLSSPRLPARLSSSESGIRQLPRQGTGYGPNRDGQDTQDELATDPILFILCIHVRSCPGRVQPLFHRSWRPARGMGHLQERDLELDPADRSLSRRQELDGFCWGWRKGRRVPGVDWRCKQPVLAKGNTPWTT